MQDTRPSQECFPSSGWQAGELSTLPYHFLAAAGPRVLDMSSSSFRCSLKRPNLDLRSMIFSIF